MGKKKVNVGVMEPHYHAAFFYAVCKICNRPYVNLTIFAREKVWDQALAHDAYLGEGCKVITIPDMDDYQKFVQCFIDAEKKSDIEVLFLNTLMESHKRLRAWKDFQPKGKLILTAHAVNAWFGKSWRINFSRPLYQMPYFIWSSMRSRPYFRKHILPKVYAINVDYRPSIGYTEHLVGHDLPVYSIPAAFYKENNGVVENDKVHFVIPGAIEKLRRDYDMLLDVFAEFPEVQLTLLGIAKGRYGKYVVDKCRHIKNIVCTGEYASEENYMSTMNSCDMIVSPLNKATCGHGAIEEWAGWSKSFNPPFNAIEYGKPLLIPSYYPVDEELKDSTVFYEFYNEGDIRDKIRFAIDTIDVLKKKAKTNAEKYYSLSALQTYFDNMIEEVMSND